MEPIIIIGGIAALIGLVAVIILFNFGATWLRAFMSGAKVTIFQLVTLQLQKIPIKRICKVAFRCEFEHPCNSVISNVL